MKLTGILLMLLLALAAAGSSINLPEMVYVGTNAVVRPLGPATVCGHTAHIGADGGAGRFLVIQCSLAEHFTWQSVTGQVYTVQSSTNLSTWTDTGVKIIGRGGLEEWYEPITQPCLFHRLLLDQ